MESKTLTFDWRADPAKPGHVEVWFHEHPALIQRGTADAATSALFGSLTHRLVGLGSYEIAYPNGPPLGLRYSPPKGFTTTVWRPREAKPSKA